MPYWKLYYHFIWGTKERLPLILPSFEPDLYRVIAAKIKELGGFVHAIGGTEDHLHVAGSVPPKLSLAKFVGEVKGNSSHFINHVVKPDLEFRWQEEYGVLSFGEKNLPVVVRYIHNQKQHHADGTLIAVMERIEDATPKRIDHAASERIEDDPRRGINPPATHTKAAALKGASRKPPSPLQRAS